MKSSLYLLLFAISVTLAISCRTERYRIVYVNSYHKGYNPSDEVMRGITDELPPDKFDLKIHFIDSKRQTSPERLAVTVDSIRDQIINFNPDVLIVSDDYAVNHLVKPYFDQLELPIVFCGINWSADQYELDRNHITGMLEVIPLADAIRFIKDYYPSASKLTVLSENSLSEQNNTRLLDTLYKNIGLQTKYMLADDFENWKKMFIKANSESDIIYLPTNGSVKNWDDAAAQKFVTENIRVPAFTCDDFMMDFCVFGFTKVPVEQGIYAAETAKKIIEGSSPSHIPITRNIQAETWFNTKLAEIIEFKPITEWLDNAKLVVYNK